MDGRKANKIHSFDYERIFMCYHESSHILISIINFFKVFSANVMTENDKEGSTNFYNYIYEDFDDLELRNHLINCEIQILFAGLIGEKIHYKDICGSEKFSLYLRLGSSSDLKTISNLIKKYNLAIAGKNRKKFKNNLISETNILLETYWKDVKLLSHALYRRRKLNYSEIKYILTKQSENKIFWSERYDKISILNDGRRRFSEESIREIYELPPL
jgi:hypothetical protein